MVIVKKTTCQFVMLASVNMLPCGYREVKSVGVLNLPLLVGRCKGWVNIISTATSFTLKTEYANTVLIFFSLFWFPIKYSITVWEICTTLLVIFFSMKPHSSLEFIFSSSLLMITSSALVEEPIHTKSVSIPSTTAILSLPFLLHT